VIKISKLTILSFEHVTVVTYRVLVVAVYVDCRDPLQVSKLGDALHSFRGDGAIEQVRLNGACEPVWRMVDDVVGHAAPVVDRQSVYIFGDPGLRRFHIFVISGTADHLVE